MYGSCLLAAFIPQLQSPTFVRSVTGPVVQRIEQGFPKL